MRVLFTGGGTGGHIFPIIAVKREIVALLKEYAANEKNIPPELSEIDFKFIGGKHQDSKEILEKEDIKVKEILSPKWRSYFDIHNFLDLFKTPVALLQSLIFVWAFMPDVIFSKGGPGSLWIVIVGWLYRIPVVIHESDTIPGKTNKIASHFSKKIVISFEETKKFFSAKKTIFTGNPIRNGVNLGSQAKAKELFNLTEKRKIILIMGGSQGAQTINLVFVDVIFKYVKKYEIIHICGENNFQEMKLLTKGLLNEKERIFYHLYPTLSEDKIKDAYAAANLIISRAGSGAIFEIAAVAKPSIIIPLPGSANDHQSLNAKVFSDSGCSLTIEEANIIPNLVYLNVEKILDNKKKMQDMTEACKKFAKPDAGKKIAETIIREA